MLDTKPTNITIKDIQNMLEQGELKVPQFQRDFKWNIDESVKLMDSIIKGYPVGAFTFWKTKVQLHTMKDIGKLNFREAPTDDYITYVLDGQQRITSIYACLLGETIKNINYGEVFVNLKASEEDYVVVRDVSGLNDDEYISLKDLIKGGNFTFITNRYGSNAQAMDKISEYFYRITSYQFAVIEVKGDSISVATEIFSRINTEGQQLSLFEIMCAVTYDENRGFDLYKARDIQKEKWKKCNYGSIKDSTVLQAVSMCINGACARNDVLSIGRDIFIDNWNDVDTAFMYAIDYMKQYYCIPVASLLPYESLLIPYVYYFYKNKEKPIGKNVERLQDYFWRCVLNNRFVHGGEGKLKEDCANVVTPILNDTDPNDSALLAVDIRASAIKDNGRFKLGNAYIKGMICLLAAQHPKSFADGADVELEKALSSESNDKNYHHFFPKAYMRKKHPRMAKEKYDHIVNITIVDGHLNKKRIKDKAPSVYMQEFKEENRQLEKTMRTHLIDIDGFGIWEDDYDVFFKKRIQKIQEQLKERLIIKSYDKIK